MTSNFSFLWSSFVLKRLGSCKSSFIKQPVIFDILRVTSYSFISVLHIEGDTELKARGFTSIAWVNLQFFSRLTLVNSFLSTVLERVSLKTTDAT